MCVPEGGVQPDGAGPVCLGGGGMCVGGISCSTKQNSSVLTAMEELPLSELLCD